MRGLKKFSLLLLLYLYLIGYNFHCGFFLLLFRFPLSYSLRTLNMIVCIVLPMVSRPPSDGNWNFTLRCFALLGFNFKNVWLGPSGPQRASVYIFGKCSSPTKSSPEACSCLLPFAGVFSNHQQVSTNQFYRKVFRFESFDIYGKLVVLFVISLYQRGRISHIMVGSCPFDSGKGQIMEEVQFKRVIIEWVPVDKVKYAPSVPKSERNRKKKMILWSYMCSLVNCWDAAVLRVPCDPSPPFPNICPSLACIEMNSTFYEVLKLKKRSNSKISTAM